MLDQANKPWGYRWRSSQLLVISSITIALFTDTFLFGFIVPILSYMLESRLQLDPSRTQNLTTALLTVHGFFAVVSAPVIAHFADKTPNRKIPLLLALTGCLIGTLLVACTPSLWAVFVGRILQSVAGSGSWVIGSALLAESVSMEHMGGIMGIAMSFIAAGHVSGPVIGGALLQLLGYGAAWSAPMVVLMLDIIARLVLLEPSQLSSSPGARPGSPVTSSTASVASTATECADETTSLLSDDTVATAPDGDCHGSEMHMKQHSQQGFYRVMLTNPRVLASLASIMLNSSIITGFNNTLSSHLRQAFGWGSLPTGMMFLCLQIPSIVLSGPAGWLRDRVGIRTPTTIGWAACIPLLCVLGIPGDPRFPWASGDGIGEPLFIGSMILFGAVVVLVRGAGPIQMTYVASDLQKENPYIFGSSRSSNRIFSMTEVAYSLGMVVGPLLTGPLYQTVGYFHMNLVLAAICLAQTGMSWVYFDRHPAH